MPTYTYLEAVADESPSSGSHQQQGGSASCAYVFSPPGPSGADKYVQVKRSVIDVLGYTGTKVTDGRIQRTLPVRHPQWDWMYADSVQYSGVGTDYTTVNVSPAQGSAVLPQVPVYDTYRVRIGFSPRAFNTWQDRDIKVVNSTWYDKDGTSKAYTYATEWYRFTKFEQYPTNNFINAQQGQMRFRTAGGVSPDPDGIQFQEAPKLYLPDSVLKVKWLSVPYRYITSKNSYLVRFIGHVNQKGFGMPQANGASEYAPGSLVYYGANPVNIYTPPVPDPGLLAFNFGNGFQRSLLCDLELTFGYTARTVEGTAPSPANGNWIAGGWNLAPWVTTRRYYYISSFDPADAANTSKWYPLFNSFPFELLFTDPDLAQAAGPFNP